MQSVHVSTRQPTTSPPAQRYDGASARGLDVIDAIRAAHDAGAYASSVTTEATGDDNRPARLTVHLHIPGSFVQRAPLSAALRVLVQLGADPTTVNIEPIHEDGAAYRLTANTHDGLTIITFAGHETEDVAA